jgi:hypothetical protein
MREAFLTLTTYGTVIYSVKHNTYIAISKQLATCSVSSEPSSGQFLVYGHGAVSQSVRTLWDPILLTKHLYFRIQFENLLADVSLKYMSKLISIHW